MKCLLIEAVGAYPGLGFGSSLPLVTLGVPPPTGIPPPAPIVPGMWSHSCCFLPFMFVPASFLNVIFTDRCSYCS